MPDWNPAEIIGIKPRPLALSLYQELITNHIWAQHRKIYGYKDLSQFHLMTTFYGTPFVDVRIDFNSWLPNNIPNILSNKIINFYLKNFKQKKYFHDKVEFEILFTCFALNTEKKINVSSNLIHAIIYAKKTKTKIFSIVGRRDGYAYKKSDISILIKVFDNNMLTPISESMQVAIWHLMVSDKRLQSNKTKW